MAAPTAQQTVEIEEVGPGDEGTGGLLHAERVRSLLALFVVIVGFVALMLVWFYQNADRSSESLSAAIVAMMSGVLGYYFGSKGVDRAQEALQDTRQQAAQAAAELDETVQPYEEKIDELSGVVGEYARLLGAIERDPALRPKVQEVLAQIRGGA